MSAASYGRDQSAQFLPDSPLMWIFCGFLGVVDASALFFIVSRLA